MAYKFFTCLSLTTALLTTMNVCVAMESPEETETARARVLATTLFNQRERRVNFEQWFGDFLAILVSKKDPMPAEFTPQKKPAKK